MAVNYGLYQLANSQMVPKRPSFPINEYMKVVDQKNQIWERAKAMEMQHISDRDMTIALPIDEDIYKKYYDDSVSVIKNWQKANNYEDLLWQVADKAREFRMNTAPINQRYQGYMKDMAEAESKAMEYKWDEQTLRDYKTAAMKNIRPLQIDEVTGRPIGAYNSLTRATRPQWQEIVDKALSGITNDEVKNSWIAKDGKAYYIVGDQRKTVDAGRVKSVLAAAIAINPDIQNWLNFKGNLSALNYSDFPFSQEDLKKLQSGDNEGKPLPQILFEMGKQQELASVYPGMTIYAVDKYRKYDRSRELSNLRLESGDGEGSGKGNGVIPFANTPFSNMTGLEDNKDLATQWTDARSKLAALKEKKAKGEQVDNDIAATEATLARLDRIKEQAQRDYMGKLILNDDGGDYLPYFKDVSASKTGVKDYQKEVIREFLNYYGKTNIDLPVMENSRLGSLNDLSLNPEQGRKRTHKTFTIAQAYAQTPGKTEDEKMMNFSKIMYSKVTNEALAGMKNTKPALTSDASMVFARGVNPVTDDILSSYETVIAMGGGNNKAVDSEGKLYDLGKDWKIDKIYSRAGMGGLNRSIMADIIPSNATEAKKATPRRVTIQMNNQGDNLSQIEVQSLSSVIFKNQKRDPTWADHEGRPYIEALKRMSGLSNVGPLVSSTIGEPVDLFKFNTKDKTPKATAFSAIRRSNGFEITHGNSPVRYENLDAEEKKALGIPEDAKGKIILPTAEAVDQFMEVAYSFFYN